MDRDSVLIRVGDSHKLLNRLGRDRTFGQAEHARPRAEHLAEHVVILKDSACQSPCCCLLVLQQLAAACWTAE